MIVSGDFFIQNLVTFFRATFCQKEASPTKIQPPKQPWAASSPMRLAFRPLTTSYKFSCFSPLCVVIFFLDTVQITVKGKTS